MSKKESASASAGVGTEESDAVVVPSKKEVLAALKKANVTEIVDLVVVDKKTGKREPAKRELTEADILSVGDTQCVLADGRKVAFA